jgi:ATP-dependent Clp protease ATP-binding subunit ClpC
MSSRPLRHSNALLIVWRLAELEAANQRSAELEPVHFFLGLLKIGELDIEPILSESSTQTNSQIQREVESVQEMAACFSQVGLETTQTRRRLRRSLPTGSWAGEMGQHIRRSEDSRDLFTKAEALAVKYGSEMVEPLHLLVGIMDAQCSWVTAALERSGITENELYEAVIAALDGNANHPMADSPPTTEAKKNPGKDQERRERGSGFAERMGRDLTELARQKQLSPVIGRKSEMRSLIQTLLQRRKNNAILIGEAGVGKTGVVEGLAQRIADGQVPPEFSQKRIVEISMASLISGTNLRGDMEERLQSLITESKNNPELILFIDEIHLLAGAGQGSGSAMDAANILKPALARGEIRVIGATTTQEFRRHIEVDAALTRRFEVIEVAEPDRAETMQILEGLRPSIEEHHGVKIDDDALAGAVDFTVRYLPSQRLPDKAIDVLDQACAQARMRSLSGDFKAQVKAGILIKRKDVAAAVAHRCKVPVGDLEQEDSDHLLNLESKLEKRVKGQSHAIEVVSEAIRLARSGLKKPGRPIAAFLFAGPSGTGKTELSKALAECLFGDENQLIRIDMSEYMESHSVSKMIGAPPGFIGHEERGQLTERVRSHPYSVVLLDEVEKAHPKILDLFLQVFDSGVLTDSHGFKCDFRETVIIMTSNLGAGTANRSMGFGGEIREVDIEEELENSVHAATKRFFRPEFVNRLTDVVVFHPLEKAHLHQILSAIVDRLNRRLGEMDASVELTTEATDFLIQEGYSPDSGARGLERTIEKELSIPLSKLVLEGSNRRVGVFHIDHKCGDIVLTISKIEF